MKRAYYLIALVFCLTVSPAFGHNVLMMANFEGHAVTGEAFYSTGEAIADAIVTVESDGATVGEGKTDGDGAFSVAILSGTTSAKVTVNAGMGHVAHEDIAREAAPEPAAEAKEAPSTISGISEQDIKKAVAAEIAPLRQMISDLHKAQTKPDIPRILGGIGYIVGLVGAFMWGRSRG
ncbi:carboxypeptidase regulatory-like domain-containing protein [Dethiosulfovibrio salsuginis]|uniref:Nickel transport protein n=1 Tax=Dethiosulfovibrio salsuginis TaxID=561720 RepID=A0A1X7J3V2_9BACT|nr:carboxypeptidase regulatory-like domain-containing protein [Dethiosulfovibrio salsuginis]SMG22112.1 nickel transport protein [Dethiosulfovibrio salsuginis]